MTMRRISEISIGACVGYVLGAITGVIVAAWALMLMRRPGR